MGCALTPNKMPSLGKWTSLDKQATVSDGIMEIYLIGL